MPITRSKQVRQTSGETVNLIAENICENCFEETADLCENGYLRDTAGAYFIILDQREPSLKLCLSCVQTLDRCVVCDSEPLSHHCKCKDWCAQCETEKESFGYENFLNCKKCKNRICERCAKENSEDKLSIWKYRQARKVTKVPYPLCSTCLTPE